jgi:hypothetical protein
LTGVGFVPKEGGDDEIKSSKKETPSHIGTLLYRTAVWRQNRSLVVCTNLAAKFGASATERCVVCEKRVYATERLPLEGGSGTVRAALFAQQQHFFFDVPSCRMCCIKSVLNAAIVVLR